jgi:hypothetical protein
MYFARGEFTSKVINLKIGSLLKTLYFFTEPPKLSSTSKHKLTSTILLGNPPIPTNIIVPLQPNRRYSCLLHLRTASSNGIYCGFTSSAMDPDEITQFTTSRYPQRHKA